MSGHLFVWTTNQLITHDFGIYNTSATEHVSATIIVGASVYSTRMNLYLPNIVLVGFARSVMLILLVSSE